MQNRSGAVQGCTGRTPTECAVPLVQSPALELRSAPSVEAATFRSLYESYFAFTWRTLRYLGVPTAQLDDAAQDLWVIVYKRHADFEGRSHIKTWLFAIAINVERNLRRVERRRPELVALPHDLSSTLDNPELTREGNEAWALVQGFLASLDEVRRAVFVACLVEGLSAAETAEVTGLDLTTVYNRVRALRRSFNLWTEQHRSEP